MTKEDEILFMLKDMRERQEKNAERLRRVERKLLGDEEFRTKGLIDQVEQHENYIHDNEKRIASEKLDAQFKRGKQKGVVIGMGIAGGTAGAGLWHALKTMFGF